jgi:iron(III) transport system substrate-binding protein
MNHKERHPCRERSLGVIGGLAALLALTAGPAMESAKAADAQPSWMKDAALVAAARKEGEVTLISSLAEEVALPQLHIFEDATGIKTNSVRGQNGSIMSRITIENRANKQTWDTVELQVVDSLPKEWLSKFKPTEAAALVPDAKDPDDHWFGIYAVFNTPAYNTNLVKRDQLPKSYEDLAKRADWAGHVAVLDDDRGWLAGLLGYYGEQKGRKLVQDIVDTIHPTLFKGHLALARSLGSGEYWVALNNAVNFTLVQRASGDPTDFWVLDPVVTTYGEAAVNAKAPHPNAGKLLVNFLISREAQLIRTKWNYIPTRGDVPTDPPGLLDAFAGKHLIPTKMAPNEDAKWQKTFNSYFKVD